MDKMTEARVESAARPYAELREKIAKIGKEIAGLDDGDDPFLLVEEWLQDAATCLRGAVEELDDKIADIESELEPPRGYYR